MTEDRAKRGGPGRGKQDGGALMEITEKTAAIEAMTELGWLYVDGETVRLAKIKRAVEAYNAALAGRPVEAGSMVDKAEAWDAIAAKNAEIASLTAAIAERDERIGFLTADFDDCNRERACWKTRAKHLEKALRFYASERRYNGVNQRNDGTDEYTSPNAAYIQDAMRDGGTIARAALQREGE